MDPTSFGPCHVEELKRRDPNPKDILLLAKKFMSDSEPFRVICLVPAEKCVVLRASFRQPSGVADRRPITEKLRKNLAVKAPACRKQGSISHDAEAYLIGWVANSLPRSPRPHMYRFLEQRRFEIPGMGPAAAITWEAPPRFRVYTILQADAESDQEVDDDAPLELLV